MDKRKLWLISGAVILVLILILMPILRPDDNPEDSGNIRPQIGLCLRQYNNDPDFGQSLKEKLIAAGYDVTIRDARNDQSQQKKQIADFLKRDCVLLVIEPVITDAADESVQLLMEKNIPAVFVNYKPEAEALQMWDKLSFVGSTKDSLGELQGQILLQTEHRGDLNEDGQISCLILSGPEDDAAAKLQAENCMNVLLGEGLLVEQAGTSWGEWTVESGRARCTKALSQYGRDVEVIICGNEAITLGALESIKAGGWQAGRDFCVIGVDAEERLHTDRMTGTVTRDLQAFADQVLAAAEELLTEGSMGNEYYVNLRPMTEETDSQ